MDEAYRKLRDDEIIQRLEWVLGDIQELQRLQNHVHIGVLNIQRISSIALHIGRVKNELESRQKGESEDVE